MDSQGVTISPASWSNDREIVVDLFTEYQNWLGEACCFHDFEAELNTLPGDYSEPTGCLLMARCDGDVLGVVGLIPLDLETNTCELKRLYVLPKSRGMGIGRALSVAILDYATKAGYETIQLETLARLEMARAIYADLGFQDKGNRIPGQSDTPLVMQCDLK
jgi:putative acetyltransferase